MKQITKIIFSEMGRAAIYAVIILIVFLIIDSKTDTLEQGRQLNRDAIEQLELGRQLNYQAIQRLEEGRLDNREAIKRLEECSSVYIETQNKIGKDVKSILNYLTDTIYDGK